MFAGSVMSRAPIQQTKTRVAPRGRKEGPGASSVQRPGPRDDGGSSIVRMLIVASFLLVQTQDVECHRGRSSANVATGAKAA